LDKPGSEVSLYENIFLNFTTLQAPGNMTNTGTDLFSAVERENKSVPFSSFALSAGAGILAVNAGTAALGLLMVATPIGWVGLIVGGVVVAGAAATASITTNNIVKGKSGGLYDQIMGRISSL
jgi:hypothetical protein